MPLQNKVNSEMNIVMSFDFGTKRIGVAVGQFVTLTARPLTTLKAIHGQPEWSMVSKIISTWQPDALVVGIPLNMDGTSQPLTQLAETFANTLRDKFNLPVFGVDERLSTKEARERIFQEGGYRALENGQIDSVAAQLILQNWLTQTAHLKK